MSTSVTHLTFEDYLSHLRTESARFRDVLSRADAEARVPACPDWDADDLLWHLGEVQYFWAGVITNRPAAPEEATPPRPQGREALLDFFDTSSASLTGALEAADPTQEAWTWSLEQTVGFTFRRQALEALVHRLDAEQATGDLTPLDPALASDGVEEVIGVMFGGHPSWGAFDALPQRLRVDLTDTGASVWVQMGVFSGTNPENGRSYADETDIALVEDPGTEPDVVIAGTAGTVLSWLWQRVDGADVAVTGDTEIYARFRSVVDHPLN